MTTNDWKTSAELSSLELRARLLREIRVFFEARDVMELETPVIASHAVTDVHLDSIQLASGHFLNTSPEYCMKRFIAEHERDVYQLCKCFRDGEAGPWHNPEFTMLEWYRIGFDMKQLMQELEALVTQLAAICDFTISEVKYVDYADLFKELTSINPHSANAAELADYARSAGIELPQGMGEETIQELASEIDRDAWLDWIMSAGVVSHLPAAALTFIYDYPASQAALARLVGSGAQPVAKRFEMYLGQVELANGYHELTDAEELGARFEKDNRKRKHLGKQGIDVDPYLLKAQAQGLPDCSGVALGVDRLLACLASLQGIDESISYTWTKV